MKRLGTKKILGDIASAVEKYRHKNDSEKQYPFPEGIEIVEDIPYYSQDGKKLYMDLYKPVTAPGVELPVIICIHGGALFMGSRKYSQGVGAMLAERGYLACFLEYRHLPAVNVYEQMADICSGMDFIGKYLVNYDVDYTRVYMLAESAGAYLATYSVAMRYSGKLVEAVGYQPSKMRVRALALISGMFYSRRKDIVGLMASSMYGKDERAKHIEPYTNPEHPQVIYNLPPCLLVTSKHDFLQKYTYEYGRALDENGIDHLIIDMGKDRKLTHSFFFIHPDYPESAVVADHVTEWFRKHEGNSQK